MMDYKFKIKKLKNK